MTVEKQVRMQRVRVGLTGLAAVVLMVAAAAALFESTKDGSSPGNATAAGSNQAAGNLIDPATETPNEPLAEIGVAPGAGPTETEKAAASEQASKPAARAAPLH